MSVLLLTVFVGIILVSLFVFLFATQGDASLGSPRDALLPLDRDEVPAAESRLVPPADSHGRHS